MKRPPPPKIFSRHRTNNDVVNWYFRGMVARSYSTKTLRLIRHLLQCTECSVAHLQRHEQTAVPAGSMGETHPAFYVVATGGSGTSAQGRLERVADSLLFPPFHRREGRYRAGNRDHRASELGAAGRRGHDIRPCPLGACLENAWNEDGQDRAWLSQVCNNNVIMLMLLFWKLFMEYDGNLLLFHIEQVFVVFFKFTLFLSRIINHEQIYNTLQSRGSRTEIHPGSDPAPWEDLWRPGGLLSRSLARRCRKIREITSTPARHPLDRIKVPRVPVLLQNDRWRTDRRFSRGDVRITIRSLGTEGVPRLGAHRFIKDTTEKQI